MVVERGYNLLKSVEGGLLVMCLRGIGKRSSEDDEFGKNRELGVRGNELTVDSDEPSQGSTYPNFHRLHILQLLLACFHVVRIHVCHVYALKLTAKIIHRRSGEDKLKHSL